MELDDKALAFEISLEECAYIDQMMRLPGWPALLKVMDGYIGAMTMGAVNVSMQEPLGNADRIAKAWAYALIAKETRRCLENGAKFEANRARTEAEMEPEAIAEARKLQSTLEAF